MDIELLFKYYYRPLCLYATHFVENVDDAEDIVQDCYLKFWEKQQENTVISDEKSYLFKAVRNTCLNFRKKQVPWETELELADLELCDEETLQNNATTEAKLWTAIDALPHKCRMIFLMNKRDNMKYQEIADKLGLSVKTIENQIGKAYKILRSKADEILYMLWSFLS